MSAEPLRTRGFVLVVDDDQDMREMLEMGLELLGFAASTCGSVHEALDFLRTSDVDAVVTDLNMPGEGGLTLCREIALRYPDTPVLVLTAFGTYEAAAEATRAGASDFLSKPVGLDALGTVVTRAIERRSTSCRPSRPP